MANISQREAKRLMKRVKDLELIINDQRHAWAAEFVSGTHLGTWPRASVGDELFGAIQAARKLRHAVVINAQSDGVKFYALPLGE